MKIATYFFAAIGAYHMILYVSGTVGIGNYIQYYGFTEKTLCNKETK